jgi:hypothetical protein
MTSFKAEDHSAGSYVVMIAGSRDFKAKQEIRYKIIELKRKWGPMLAIWTGGAIGADEEAEKSAREWGVMVLPSKRPDYSNNPPKVAPIMRNHEMVEDPRVKEVVAFWDGESPGTHDVIKHCIEHHKNFTVIFDRRPVQQR